MVEPITFQEAMKSEERLKWVEAMEDEMKSLHENETWESVNRPKDARIIECKWLYKLKDGVEGGPPRFKSRLVAKGFTQRAGVEYNEIFAHVVKHTTIRVLLTIVAQLNLELEQLDVKTAFPAWIIR
jgi:hypothetical protein